jgi:archaemetzincin
MNLLQLLPIGKVDSSVLDELGVALSTALPLRHEVLKAGLDPEPSFHAGRRQYFSTDILARMQRCFAPGCWRLLGIASVDLYIPILTFVFGEAQLNGACAVVSAHRLRQEFYGLPPDPDLSRQRLVKEALHELGHTLGLTHCDDYRCAMAPSHAVESIDLKSTSLCVACQTRSHLALFPRPGNEQQSSGGTSIKKG